MSFYYTREPGAEGQILTGDGEAVGLPLSVLVDRQPMPVRGALELLSYLADILTIAEEDRVTHGDIEPGDVRVDETGAVSIEGWGAQRRSGRAPEGASAGPPSDVYGLGIVLHAALTTQGMGALPRDREGHDAAVSDRLASIDWQDLADKRWMDEVLHFLCGMMAFEPELRPVPLDVANILGQVAQQAPGEGLVAWAARAVGPRAAGEARRPAAFEPEEEDLGGPQALAAPVSQTQAFSMRKAASAKGEATAFWTRDRIAQMLAADEDDDEDEDVPRRIGGEPVRERFDPTAGRRRAAPPAPPPPRPTVPPPVPPFPDATMEGQPAIDPDLLGPPRRSAPPPNLASSHDAPEPPGLRPVGARAPAPPPPTPAPPLPQRGAAPPAGGFGAPPPAPSPFAQPGGAAPGAAPPRAPVAQGPVARGPVAQGPVAGAPLAQGPVPGGPVPQPAPKKGGGAVKVVIGVVVLLVLLCGGGSILSGGVWYLLSTREEVPEPRPAVVDEAPEADEGAGTQDTGTRGPAEAPPEKAPARGSSGSSSAGSSRKSSTSTGSGSRSSGSAGSRRSAGSSGATSSGSRRSSGSSGSSTTSGASGSSGSSRGTGSSGSSSAGGATGGTGSTAAANPPPTSAGGSFPATVKWIHQGVETTLECSPGGRSSFVGTMRMEITDVTTCRVKTDTGGMTAVQLRGGGTVTCSEAGGRLVCTGP